MLFAEAAEHFGRIDILVANHGVWPVEDVPIEKNDGSAMAVDTLD